MIDVAIPELQYAVRRAGEQHARCCYVRVDYLAVLLQSHGELLALVEGLEK